MAELRAAAGAVRVDLDERQPRFPGETLQQIVLRMNQRQMWKGSRGHLGCDRCGAGGRPYRVTGNAYIRPASTHQAKYNGVTCGGKFVLGYAAFTGQYE